MSRTTRRRFVQQSAALGLGLTTGLSGRAFAAINDKVSVACIGVRGRGNSVMHSFAAEPDCENHPHLRCQGADPPAARRGDEGKDRAYAQTGQ